MNPGVHRLAVAPNADHPVRKSTPPPNAYWPWPHADDRDEGDSPRGSLVLAARIRRQRPEFDRVSFRSRQNALIESPDRYHASSISRQARTRSGLRGAMKEFSA